ncbi:MAG TPA: hypothetical protein VD833_19900 [Vicinamibacterales bacterium]|nr:hypothetical protein [Vicinamibacterales bacterium]
MRSVLLRGCLAAAIAGAVLGGTPAVPQVFPRDRIWFAPAPGSLDLLRLFESVDEWPRARQTLDVFKFYHQHTFAEPPDIVGPNSYDALVRVDAFRKLRQWGKRVALEAGSVKEFYCTADDSGMRESIELTLRGLEAVHAAGGLVSYLAMDEPFLAGQAPQCGGPALEPTADRVSQYIRAVRQRFPAIRIGLIEAYPYFRPEAFASMLRLLKERGTPAAFLHVDAYLPALQEGRDAFGSDMIRLADVSAASRIPFGIIIWGENGNADHLYAADALKLAEAVSRTFRGWDVMPDHLIFQSWAESSTGLRITPTNLPEQQADTHTRLLNDIYRTFREVVIPATRRR